MLFLFSFLLTELNVTLLLLTTVMLGSNCIKKKSSTGTRFVFIAVVIQRSVKRKKREKNNACELNVSQPRQPLCSTALIPYLLNNLPSFVCFFQISTGEDFLNQFKKRLATRHLKLQLQNSCT